MTGAPRSDELTVGVLGASGLLGLQLVSMLSRHRLVAELIPFSATWARQSIARVTPAFQHVKQIRFIRPTREALEGCDVVFSAMPHGESFRFVDDLVQDASGFFDLSADYRLSDATAYQQLHGAEHPRPELLTSFRQILPEVNGDDCTGTSLFSVPGCNSTAILLALHPFLAEGLLDSDTVLVDSKVGSSGAGSASSQGTEHYQRADGVRVHKVLGEHRHSVEVADFCKSVLGKPVKVHLTVHSVDMVRGVLCSTYLRLRERMEKRDLHTLFRSYYGRSACVRIVSRASGFNRFPNPRLVAGTNFCDIGFGVDPSSSQIVVFSALDNLLKGGAGQALQVFNRWIDADETESLPMTVSYP